MASKWGSPIKHTNGDVWQYWIDSKFAFTPMYMQGQLVWLQWYWITWPVDQNGHIVELYRSFYPYNPDKHSGE